MSLQQRSLLNINRENPSVQNLKSGLLKPAADGDRLVLNTRSTNLALPERVRGKAGILKAAAAVPAAEPVAVVPKQATRNPSVIDIHPIPKVQLPLNIVDIDQNDLDCLEFNAIYVKETYDYLFKIEPINPVLSQYLQRHPTLRAHMRMILIEWLVSLQSRFKLLQETLLMTVSILDRFMSETDVEVSRGKFQLVGVACMLVACKYEEMYLPSVSDFAYMCDGAYSADDILRMERRILNTLKFDFKKPLSAHFLRRFSKAGEADSQTHTVAKYFLELALYDYNLVHCSPSAIAASALFIAGSVTGEVEWNETLEFYSTYKLIDLSYVVSRLAELGVTAESNKYLKTTFKKYAGDKFHRVARSVNENELVLSLIKKNPEEPKATK